MDNQQLASILVGDHLGQVKKVLWPSGEISPLQGLGEPSSSNPIVSIEQLPQNHSKYLIASKDGSIYIYNSVNARLRRTDLQGCQDLIKAFPIDEKNFVLIYEKCISFDGRNTIHQKKGHIRNGKVKGDKLAVVGKDIPLKVFDLKTKNKIFEAEPPERGWLGVKSECEVSDLDFVSLTRIATCSKSDSMIRVYDLNSETMKLRPIISIDISQTAFNEYAEAGRFVSLASTGDEGHKIVTGSNVGQLLAIDLRFTVKRLNSKKKLQPRTSKILGGFKGSRGATFKDIKIILDDQDQPSFKYKVISCCLDRYLRVHDFSKETRQLQKHVYMKTKPLCCSPIFYKNV